MLNHGAEATSPGDRDRGGGTELCICREFGSRRGDLEARSCIRRRLLHAPVEPWKNPGARAGQGRREQRRPGPDAVMEKPIGAPARGRRAWQQQHLAGRSGGAAPSQNHQEQGEVPGAGKMRDRSLVPGVTTLRVPINTAGSRSCIQLVHAKSCTWPLGWRTEAQQRVAATTWGETRTDPTLARGACTRSSAHTITYTHVRPDTRAAYNSQGRRKETVGQKGEEMK